VSRFDAVDERRRIFLAMVALQNGAIVFAVDGLENDELGREFWLGHVSRPPGIWKSILVRDQRVCEIRHMGIGCFLRNDCGCIASDIRRTF